jgi:hypothetical protein
MLKQRTDGYKQRSRNVEMLCRVQMRAKREVTIVVVRNSHYCNADVSSCVGDGGCSEEGLSTHNHKAQCRTDERGEK